MDMLRKRATISENAVQSGKRVYVGTPKAPKQRTVPLPSFLLPYLGRQCEGKSRDALLCLPPGQLPDSPGRWDGDSPANLVEAAPFVNQL